MSQPSESATPVPATETSTPTPTANATPTPTEKSENETPKKATTNQKPKSKKRKKIRDVTAPLKPLTGYLRFLNDRRDQFRADNPTMPFSEIMKTLAAEWSTLPHDQKQQYLVAAEQDRERYLTELAAYKQSAAYREFSERQAESKEKRSSTAEPADTNSNSAAPAPTPAPPPPPPPDIPAVLDIPIFTEEFLDHNKSREAEVRQLRKSNTDYEQQNAAIETYVAGLQSSLEKLSAETQQQRNANAALRRHLAALRTNLTNALTNIHVPGLEAPTIDSIDQYVLKVTTFVKEDPNHPAVNKLRSAVSQLDMQHP